MKPFKKISVVATLLMGVSLLTSCEGLIADKKTYNHLYNVIFYTGTGSNQVQASYIDTYFDVEEGALIEKPEDPTCLGATFLGWYKDLAKTDPWDFENDPVMKSIILYSKWIFNDYTVTYVFDEAGGDFLDPAVTSFNILTSKILPKASRPGSVFKGWSLTSFETYKVGDPLLSTTKGQAQDLTLYAIFTNTNYNVRFFSLLEGVSNPKVHSVEYVSDINFPVLADTAANHFVGWFSKDGTDTDDWGFQYVNGEPYLGRATYDETLGEWTFAPAGVNVYAKWEPK